MAIKIGLNIIDFWKLNPRQFEKYVKEYNNKQLEDAKLRNINNYNLGVYVRAAMSETYPSEPFDLGIQEEKPQSDSEVKGFCRGLARKLGGEVILDKK